MGQNLKHIPKSFARKQSHENKALLKLLSKESVEAVDTLHKLLSSEDDKIKLGAAKTIIELQRDLANDINEDEIKRMIGSIKYGGPQELEEDRVPQIDFSGEDLD